ncbi:MAG: DUF805 domain-containing protein [Muribaculaceae bacterium]|nr:DUF805 domain-containing protein [Muribaculaceae bacterium]
MYQRQLTFGEAVKLALTTNYCNFNGRSSRSEFWWYALFTFILSSIISLIFSGSTLQVVSGIINLALLLPGLGLAVRRLHDVNKSGWWVLINLIPVVGWIIYIVWVVKESDPVPNQYGPVPNLVQG